MKKTIYVVDDSDTDLVQAKEALEDHYTVVTMSSARKMLFLLDKIRPELILLDIEMPQMDGFRAMRRLRTHYADIPVIFLTAQLHSEIEKKCLEMGAVDFISKPFNAKELLDRLTSHLSPN